MKIAIVGATGAVGRTMVKVLDERGFPVSELKLFAREGSAGLPVYFNRGIVRVQPLKLDSFNDCDIALFSAGSSVSRIAAPLAVEAECFVIDNSSAWRMDNNVPLVVPEVNPETLEDSIIIANPNCSTIQMVVALAPIHRAVGIERIVVSTYQAVSGAGKAARDELVAQTKALVEKRPIEERGHAFPHPMAFNCIPHIDAFEDDGSTKEELKMVNETRKILGLSNLAISATCVRVPVLNGHAESVNVQTKKKLSANEARELLRTAPGVKLADDPANNSYPLQTDADGQDEVFVGRIREDTSVDNGLNMWIVADNLRKGAATNAVQIAELLLEKHF